MSQILSSRLAQTGLVLLLLFFLVWDMRAVVADQRMGPTDTTVDEAQLLLEMVSNDGPEAVPIWAMQARKGPMAGLLVALFSPLVGETLLAARLIGVILHALLLLALFLMATKVTGRSWVGLLAVVISGTYPGEFGWFRMEYHDALLTLVTMLAVWQLAGDLRSRRRAVLLGLTLALGILSKVPFPVFIIGPGLLFAWRNLRDRRSWANAGLAAAAFMLAAGWYLVPNVLTIHEYVDGSHEPQFFSLAETFHGYFLLIPRTIPHFAAALVAAPIAWRMGTASGPLVASLLSSICTGTLILFYFDPWSRYLMPAYPQAGLLAALGLAALLQRLADHRVHLAQAALAMVVTTLLGLYVRDNIVGITHPEDTREWGAGLIAPDRRSYRAFPEMVNYIRERKLSVYTVGWTSKIEGCPQQLPRLWSRRGYKLSYMEPLAFLSRLKQGQAAHLLLCHRELAPLQGLSRVEALEASDREVLEAARAASTRPLVSFSDPDGVRLTLLLVK